MEILEMKFFKKIEKKIKDFFNESMDYNKKEGILFIVIFFIMIILTIGISGIFSKLLLQMGIIYVLFSFAIILYLIDVDDFIVEYIILVLLLPYICLIMLIDNIFKKFVPYRGDNPMLIRSYKIRYLKRKARINKIKFWK